jgi:ATPase subunit of ABC transporter with duplicated ATPase domains
LTLIRHNADAQNGQGKSTLAKAILSAFSPAFTSPAPSPLRITNPPTANPHARVAVFDQHTVEALAAPDIARRTALQHLIKTAAEAAGAEGAAGRVAGIGGAEGGVSEAEGRRFLGGLGLHGATAADVPIGQLSGGQRVRLGLGLVLYRPPHLL